MDIGVQTTSRSNGDDISVRRFKVNATGETGVAAAPQGLPRNTTRAVTLGDEWNVAVVDLCIEETGELKTYRLDRLTEVS